MKVSKKNIVSKAKWVVTNIWFFPVIVCLVFFSLVALGINGSSIGMYNEVINKASTSDPDLILGKPRAIRSDEWIVITQMVISQKEAGYPSINPNIGNGQDMNVALDVPSRDWSQLFRPQNHAFFALPFNNAFAYRWWFFAAVLMVAIYFFTLNLLPGRKLIASFLALSVYFSGFVQWWYQTTTLGTLAYAVIIALLIIKMLRETSAKRRVVLSLALIYAFVCFAIILYPPFQIPCALVVASFVIGYAFHVYQPKKLLQVLKTLAPYIAAIVLSVVFIIGLYLYQNRDAINALSNTSYPGKRVIESGGYNPLQLLSGSVAIQFLTNSTAQFYTPQSNQSEASTFIFLSFFLIPPILFVILKRIDSIKRIEKSSLSDFSPALLMGLAVPFMLFIAWLFFPGLAIIGKLTLLNMVPLNRLIIGFGLLNLFATIVFIRIFSKNQNGVNRKIAAIFSIMTFLFCVFINSQIEFSSPGFIRTYLVVLLAIPVPVAVFLFLRKKFNYSVGLIALFSIVSTSLVNPLYYGVGDAVNNPIINTIHEYPDDGSYWVADDILIENFPLMAGRKSLSGVFYYPQKELWKRIDNGSQETRYNRYAHVIYTIDNNPREILPTSFADSSADTLIIKAEACSDFLRTSGVRHIISSTILSSKDQSCIVDTKTVSLPQKTYYIYTTR